MSGFILQSLSIKRELFQWAWTHLLIALCLSVCRLILLVLSSKHTQTLTTFPNPGPNYTHLSDCCNTFLDSLPACVLSFKSFSIQYLKVLFKIYTKSYHLFCFKSSSFPWSKSQIPCNGTSLPTAVPLPLPPHLPLSLPQPICPPFNLWSKLAVSLLLPQGLCTYCSSCLECYSSLDICLGIHITCSLTCSSLFSNITISVKTFLTVPLNIETSPHCTPYSLSLFYSVP